MRIFIVIFIALFTTSSCQQVTLIGSHLLPIESAYKVYLTASDLNDDSVINVTLSSDSDQFFQVFENAPGNLDKEIDFEPPFTAQSTYTLNIIETSKSTDSCREQSVKLETPKSHQKIFIQLDQPVYRTNEDIRFRVIALDHKSLPLNEASLNVSIVDAKGNDLKRFENLQTSKFGVVENYFKISNYTNVGQWHIRVNSDEKEATKSFQVQEKGTDDFSVLVDTQKEVAFVDRKIFLNIQVKRKDNKLFTGTAKMSANARFVDSDHPQIRRTLPNLTLPNDLRLLTIDIENDLGILTPEADMLIELEVNVVEDSTEKSLEKVIVEILMRHKGRNKLTLTRKSHFKPGFDFPMKITARDLRNKLDQSVNSMKMVVVYEDDSQQSGKVETFDMFLKNGEASVPLHPSKNTRKIKVHFEFAGTELTEEIEAVEDDEFMQAAPAGKTLNVGETVVINTKTSNKFENLHVLVIGQFGLVYSKNYPEAKKRDEFEFSLELTEEMRPESYVIVFYVRKSDGAVIYDEFPLSLGFSVGNSLEISAPDKAKPNEQITFNFKTAKDSMVFITAVDLNSALLNRDNEVSRSAVYNEIISYMNRKFNNASAYQFDRFNAFVVQASKTGADCAVDEFFKFKNDILHPDEQQPSIAEILERKYFPQIWFQEKMEAKSDQVNSFQKQLPNSLTSWRIYAASIHPTLGFVVARKEPKILVSNELAIKIHAPDAVRLGETVKIDLSAFSFLKTAQNGKFDVSIQNGDLMTQNKENFGNKKCLKYASKNLSTSTINVQLPASAMSSTQSILVKPKRVGVLTVKVTATAGNFKDVAEKLIRVENEKELKTKVLRSFLIDLNDGGIFELQMGLDFLENLDVEGVYSMISGGLMGPLMTDTDSFSNLPIGYIEYDIDKFTAATVKADSLKSQNLEITQELQDELLAGYQATLFLLQLNESLPTTSIETWFCIDMIVKLIEASEFIDVDYSVVEEALDRLRKRQKPNGSWHENPVMDLRRDIGKDVSKDQVLTAKAVEALIKYQAPPSRYSDVFEKAITFMESTIDALDNDYVKVLYAYALKLAGADELSKSIVDSMQLNFMEPSALNKHKSMYVEIAAYLIMIRIRCNEDPKDVVDWLISQRQPDGTFYSSYDSALALKALNDYSKFRNVTVTAIDYVMDDSIAKGTLSSRDSSVNTKIKSSGIVLMSTSGTGLGYGQIYYKEKEKSSKKPEIFKIDVKTKNLSSKMIQVEVKFEIVGDVINRTNLLLAEVEMPRGYQYVSYERSADIEKQKVDSEDNGSKAVFYLEMVITGKTYRLVAKAVKVYDIANHAKSTVKVYDYYRPNIRDEVEYDYDLNAKECSELEQKKKDDAACGSLRRKLKLC